MMILMNIFGKSSTDILITYHIIKYSKHCKKLFLGFLDTNKLKSVLFPGLTNVLS